MQIQQRETQNHQGAITHEVCCLAAQYSTFFENSSFSYEICSLVNQLIGNVLLDLWFDPRKAVFKEWSAVTTLVKHFCNN